MKKHIAKYLFMYNPVYKRNESQTLVIDKSNKKPLATRRINLQQTLIRISYVLTNNNTLYHLSDYK